MPRWRFCFSISFRSTSYGKANFFFVIESLYMQKCSSFISSFSCCDAQPARFILVYLNILKSGLFQIYI